MMPEQNQFPQEPQPTAFMPPVAPAKKNKLVPLVVILSIISVAGIGFSAYEAFFKEPQASTAECDIECSENSTNSIVDLSEVRSLVSKFIVMQSSTDPMNIFKDGITDDYKYYITMDSLDYKITKESDGMSGKPCFEYDITYEKLNDAYHEIFGSDSNVKNTADFCGKPSYSEELKKYVGSCGCGGADTMSYDYEILGYETADDKLIVKVAYIEIEGTEEGSLLTLNNGEQENIGQSNIGKNYGSKKYEYINQVPTFNLTFEKENDHYIFTDIQKL